MGNIEKEESESSFPNEPTDIYPHLAGGTFLFFLFYVSVVQYMQHAHVLDVVYE